MSASIGHKATHVESAFGPFMAHTSTHHELTPPIAHDFVKLVFVRVRSAILGDVVILASNTLCGGAPEGHVRVTTVYLDPDYIIDQVFWQYAAVLSDGLHAR